MQRELRESVRGEYTLHKVGNRNDREKFLVLLQSLLPHGL